MVVLLVTVFYAVVFAMCGLCFVLAGAPALTVTAGFTGVFTMYGLCFALSRWRTKSRLALACKAALYPAAICSIGVAHSAVYVLAGEQPPAAIAMPGVLVELLIWSVALAVPVFAVALYWTRPGQRPTITPRT